MSSTAELVREYTYTKAVDEPAPDLMRLFAEARSDARSLVPSLDTPQRASVEEFIAWLDSEDFEDGERIRAEAWRG